MCLMDFDVYLYRRWLWDGDDHRVEILFNNTSTALIQMAEPDQAQFGNGTEVGCCS